LTRSIHEPVHTNPNQKGVTPSLNAKVGASVTQANAPTPTVLGPPAVVTPSPPVGFVQPADGTGRGYRPSAHVLAAATTAIADLGSFDNYVALLGSAAPSAASISSAISILLAWRAVRTPAAAWDTYVRAQYALACKAALQLLDELKPLFLAAAAKDPALALTYQGLTEIFEAPNVVASKAAATRKRKAQQKAVAAKSIAAPSPAASGEAEATETTTKAVTINA